MTVHLNKSRTRKTLSNWMTTFSIASLLATAPIFSSCGGFGGGLGGNGTVVTPVTLTLVQKQAALDAGNAAAVEARKVAGATDASVKAAAKEAARLEALKQGADANTAALIGNDSAAANTLLVTDDSGSNSGTTLKSLDDIKDLAKADAATAASAERTKTDASEGSVKDAAKEAARLVAQGYLDNTAYAAVITAADVASIAQAAYDETIFVAPVADRSDDLPEVAARAGELKIGLNVIILGGDLPKAHIHRLKIARIMSGDGGWVAFPMDGFDKKYDPTKDRFDRWVDSLNLAYEKGLTPIADLRPFEHIDYTTATPMGNGPKEPSSSLVDQHDSDTTKYTELAARYKAHVKDLLEKTAGAAGDKPLWVKLGNEPNLCTEWWGEGKDRAKQFAYFMRDVTAALRDIGNERLRIMGPGFAPYGNTVCTSKRGQVGTVNVGESSKSFIGRIASALGTDNNVFAKLDAFGAQGKGRHKIGTETEDVHNPTTLYKDEYFAAGFQESSEMKIFLVETGHCADAADIPSDFKKVSADKKCLDTWDQVASDIEKSYAAWDSDPKILGALQFMIQRSNPNADTPTGFEEFAVVDERNCARPHFLKIQKLNGLDELSPCDESIDLDTY